MPQKSRCVHAQPLVRLPSSSSTHSRRSGANAMQGINAVFTYSADPTDRRSISASDLTFVPVKFRIRSKEAATPPDPLMSWRRNYLDRWRRRVCEILKHDGPQPPDARHQRTHRTVNPHQYPTVALESVPGYEEHTLRSVGHFFGEIAVLRRAYAPPPQRQSQERVHAVCGTVLAARRCHGEETSWPASFKASMNAPRGGTDPARRLRPVLRSSPVDDPGDVVTWC